MYKQVVQKLVIEMLYGIAIDIVVNGAYKNGLRSAEDDHDQKDT